jgi:hypothetical protein
MVDDHPYVWALGRIAIIRPPVMAALNEAP